MSRLGRPYGAIVGVGAVLTLARFSEAFLVLRAQELGLSITYAPAVLVVMNLAYALSAFPAGVLSDRMSRRGMLALGIVVLIVADVCLATAGGVGVAALGVLAWGLHLGLTQGLLSAMIADATPAELRGTAFGLFNLAGGVAMLLASVLAGALWDHFGSVVTFACGAALAAVATTGIWLLAAPSGLPSNDR